MSGLQIARETFSEARPSTPSQRPPTRVAILSDLREERWASMDLVADSLTEELRRNHSDSIVATQIRPPLRRRFTRDRTNEGRLFNTDRFVNRFTDYPRFLRRVADGFDVFHIIDHSYAQLVHELPAHRTIVTCHDLDTFRCLFDPAGEPRSLMFRLMMERVLKGMKQAAVITCDSETISRELLAKGVVAPERVVVVANGVSQIFSSQVDPFAETQVAKLLGEPRDDDINFLHVGSTIGRKRIDVLLEVFARVRSEFPRARLIRVGGAFDSDQLRLIKRLQLEPAILLLPFVEQRVLAAIYQRATMLLQTSEREGFGLPLIEALACGTPAISSDIPVLREVAGDAATFCRVGDIESWTRTLVHLLHERTAAPDAWQRRRRQGVEQAAKYSWANYTQRMADIYSELSSREVASSITRGTSIKPNVRREPSHTPNGNDARGNAISVLHVGKFYAPHKGGMESHMKDLCERLLPTIQTEVLVASETRSTSETTVNGVRVTRAAKLFSLDASSVCPEMVRTIRNSRARIVHLHLPNPTGILSYLAAGHDGILIVTYHSDVVRQKILGRAFQPILDHILRRAFAVIVTSPNYIESSPVLKRFRERCRVIPLGISPGKFQQVDANAVSDIRARYGNRIVLSIGRLIYYKGYDHLVRAMASVKGQLVIIGEGPLRKSLETVAKEAGVAERVSFLGEIKDVAQYLHAADVFALPSIARSEAFGMVQLEAMACGKPVVNTSIASGAPCVSLDGVTGITVPPADADALAAALTRLLDDDVLRSTFGAAGRLRVAQEFDADLMTQRTISVYKEALRTFDDRRLANNY